MVQFENTQKILPEMACKKRLVIKDRVVIIINFIINFLFYFSCFQLKMFSIAKSFLVKTESLF